MLKTLFWLTWVFLYLFGRLPAYFKTKRLKREGRQQEVDEILAYQVNRWVSRLFKHIGLRLTVEGRENLPQDGEPVVFVANHQSYLDIPIFINHLDAPHALMAKQELGKIPFLGGWMNMLDCVYVGREDIRAAAQAMREAEDLVKRGRSIVICPEGTRSMSDEMGEFKQGAVRVAVRGGVRIVPLAVDGSHRLLEGNRYRLQAADVRLVVLPALDPAAFSKEEQKGLHKKLEEMIRAAKDNRGGGV